MNLSLSDPAGHPVSFPTVRFPGITSPLTCGSDVSEAGPASAIGPPGQPRNALPGIDGEHHSPQRGTDD
jgi:hypothetical protein